MRTVPPSTLKTFRILRAAFCVCGSTTGVLLTLPALAGDPWDVNSLLTSELQVGGIVVTQPKYEGGSRYRVYGFPIVIPESVNKSDWITFRGSEDIRIRVLEYQGLELGPVTGWRFTRDESNGPLLEGLGDVKGGLVLGAYAGYRIGQFFPFLSYHHQVTGDETGGALDFGTEFKVPVSPNFSYTLLAGATYAGSNYMNSYFTVTDDQSNLSGLNTYDASPGIKDVYIGLISNIPLTQDWTMKVGANYTRLVGDAADSPVVETANQFYGGLGLTYRFDPRR